MRAVKQTAVLNVQDAGWGPAGRGKEKFQRPQDESNHYIPVVHRRTSYVTKPREASSRPCNCQSTLNPLKYTLRPSERNWKWV